MLVKPTTNLTPDEIIKKILCLYHRATYTKYYDESSEASEIIRHLGQMLGFELGVYVQKDFIYFIDQRDIQVNPVEPGEGDFPAWALWYTEDPDGNQIPFPTEDSACCYQREWRKEHSLDPMTGELV